MATKKVLDLGVIYEDGKNYLTRNPHTVYY